MLKNKKIEDADKFVKDTYNCQYYCRGINEGVPGSYEARPCAHRQAVLKAMQKTASKLNYRLDVIFEEGKVSHLKWYHNDIWIRVINGYHNPILPPKNLKPKRNPIPGVLRHEVFRRDGHRCLECGATNHEIRLEVDHIIPVSQGGTDELNNLQTLCYKCNQAKGNRAWTAGRAL